MVIFLVGSYLKLKFLENFVFFFMDRVYIIITSLIVLFIGTFFKIIIPLFLNFRTYSIYIIYTLKIIKYFMNLI